MGRGREGRGPARGGVRRGCWVGVCALGGCWGRREGRRWGGRRSAPVDAIPFGRPASSPGLTLSLSRPPQPATSGPKKLKLVNFSGERGPRPAAQEREEWAEEERGWRRAQVRARCSARDADGRVRGREDRAAHGRASLLAPAPASLEDVVGGCGVGMIGMMRGVVGGCGVGLIGSVDGACGMDAGWSWGSGGFWDAAGDCAVADCGV